ncbi:MAG: short-chain dehydrogenase [Spirochaetaceae bacterium]|nr:short-chain dehydrogenase [Spirochaetaceae bacterium]|tara:strand:- start:39758 stop:40528 length:771 start_codon:yes stop_codon:yes gene_type:complete
MKRNDESGPGAALVTGGAIRLGKALATGLAGKGYDILLHYNRSEGEAEKTASEIRALGVQCHTLQMNLDSDLDSDSLIERALERQSNLNVLVNSASVYDGGTISMTTPEIFDRNIQVNFKAPFFLSRSFQDRVKSGNIVNILDNKISFNQYHYAAYLLSKKMLAEFTTLAALEFAPDIRVNGIAPGVILPASVRSEQYISWRLEAIPLKRKGDTDHIIKALHYLLENDFVSGQILMVDGAEGKTSIGRNAESYQGD